MAISDNLEKKTMHFFAGDWQRLQELYPNVRVSVLIRTLIHKHIEDVDASVEAGNAAKLELKL